MLHRHLDSLMLGNLLVAHKCTDPNLPILLLTLPLMTCKGISDIVTLDVLLAARLSLRQDTVHQRASDSFLQTGLTLMCMFRGTLSLMRSRWRSCLTCSVSFSLAAMSASMRMPHSRASSRNQPCTFKECADRACTANQQLTTLPCKSASQHRVCNPCY